MTTRPGQGADSWRRVPLGSYPLELQVVRALEDLEDAVETIDCEHPDPDELQAMIGEEEQERREAENDFLSSLDAWKLQEYREACDLEADRKAAAARLGRGAKGMSERSRREMWRWVLSLPFEMLGDRPLWITLSYPGEWQRWVPDGPTLERHRRAFGEAWYRGFGERPVGFWSKEFQLKVGRPHLHLLMKGPDAMRDADYRGFQLLTRVGNENVRRMGRRKGRWWTPPIGAAFGGETATEMLRWWSQITTGATVENHARRGVNVRTVFYARDDCLAAGMRRAPLAAYMAGEAAKSGQKGPAGRLRHRWPVLRNLRLPVRVPADARPDGGRRGRVAPAQSSTDTPRRPATARQRPPGQ